MSDLPNLSEEYDFFEKLFDNAEKEQVGDLYKKELYIMKEVLESNKYKTTLKLMHDTLLQKFMCEEYTEFIPKNEVSQILFPPDKKDITNNKNSQKDDGVDKELLEEYEFLKELYRLNYLTFSPLALEYFEKINEPRKKNFKKNEKEEKNINNNNKNKINNENFYEEQKKEDLNDEQKEKDEKLSKLLNFDYNNFELNNDLLFNISQGFIDLNKLKESNLKFTEKCNQNKDNSESYDSSKNDEFDIYEYDEELNNELVQRTMKFVKNYEQNQLFKQSIARFKEELSKLPFKCKNKIKNEFFKIWEAEFTKIEKEHQIIVKKKEEEERKEQLIKQKNYLERLKKEKEREKEKKLETECDLIKELQKLKKDAKMKNEKDNINKKIKKKKAKRIYKSISPSKKEVNKRYYCSGFNLYKEVFNNKKRNVSSN